ncbi:MAG: enoyl-ACP reductase FabI [Actinobacteria bacterium]|nr:enoyl-ACP reductase FabI [Actinomycetota bacterium]
MLLEGKKIVVTGVLTDASIAFDVARIAQEQGAEIVLTSFGRAMSLTQRIAKRLPSPPDVLELDATSADNLAAVAAELEARWGRVDGVVHAIGFAPASCLGGEIFDAEWADISTAIEVSTYSLKSIATALLPLMQAAGGGSIVGLDFDATQAFPTYNWMGVAKAALESLSRYLARDLGPSKVRCNLIAAGPLRTMAAKSIPGFGQFEDIWTERAPLGWDLSDKEPAAKAVVALLSDWFPATTGEIIHVDGGFHAVGA